MDYRSLTSVLRSDLETEKLVKGLLEKGADVSITDADDKTALHRAAELGYKALTRLSLEQDADVTARNLSGRTALDIAIW